MNKKQYKQKAKDARLEAGKLLTEKQLVSCNAIIHTATVACGACGAIPIPIADAIPMTAAQITMVISLGKVFDVQLTETIAKTILASVAAPLVGRAVAGGAFKFIPVAGWIASAALAAIITETIGWVIVKDFAIKYKAEYKLEMEKKQAEDLIKQEKERAAQEWENNFGDLNDPADFM